MGSGATCVNPPRTVSVWKLAATECHHGLTQCGCAANGDVPVLLGLFASLLWTSTATRAQFTSVDTVVAYMADVRSVATTDDGRTFMVAPTSGYPVLNGLRDGFDCGVQSFDPSPISPRPLDCIRGATTALVARSGDHLIVAGHQLAVIGGVDTPLMAKVELPHGIQTTWRLSPEPSSRLPTSIDRMVEIAGGIVVASGSDQATNESVVLRVDMTTGVAATVLVVPGTIRALSPSSDGGVLVGGDFAITLSGQERRGLVKLRPGSFQVDPDYGAGPGVALTAVAGAAGAGALVAREDTSTVVRVDASGVVDHGWSVAADGAVRVITTDAAQNVYLAGGFSNVNGVPRRAVAKVSSQTGAVDAGWLPELINGTVTGLAINGDSLVLSGAITAPESHQAGVVRLSIATAAPPAAALRIRMGDTGSSGPSPLVSRVFSAGDGDLIVAGSFVMTGRQVVPGAVRIDRFGNERSAWAPRIRGRVRAGAAGADGTVFLSGRLARTSDSQLLWQVVRVAGPNGAVDPDWRAVMQEGPADALAVQASSLYLLGWFTAINETPAVLASRVSLATPAAVDPTYSPSVTCCILRDYRAILPQGDATALLNYASGGFIDFDPPPPPGPPVQPLQRLQPRSGNPSSLAGYGPLLDSALADVQNVLVDGRGDRYLLGRLRSAADPARTGIVRMLANGDIDLSMANFSAECRPYGPGTIGADGLLYLACEEPGGGSFPTRRLLRLVPGTGEIDRDWFAAEAPAPLFRKPTHLAAAGDRVVVFFEQEQGGELDLISLSTAARPLFADGMEASPAP